jgi:hypothetical protein
MVGRPWNNADGEGRRVTITLEEEKLHDPRTLLRQLLGQEKRPALPPNSGPFTLGGESFRHLCLRLCHIGETPSLTGSGSTASYREGSEANHFMLKYKFDLLDD